MTNKHREDGGMSTDLTKFTIGELTKIRQALQKSQGAFLQASQGYFWNYMDPAKCGYADEDELAEAHEQCDHW